MREIEKREKQIIELEKDKLKSELTAEKQGIGRIHHDHYQEKMRFWWESKRR